MIASEPHTSEFTDKSSETSTSTDIDELCAACAHPWHEHDALGVRFCTASIMSSLSRGCICK
jgi:hypothetical protein